MTKYFIGSIVIASFAAMACGGSDTSTPAAQSGANDSTIATCSSDINVYALNNHEDILVVADSSQCPQSSTLCSLANPVNTGENEWVCVNPYGALEQPNDTCGPNNQGVSEGTAGAMFTTQPFTCPLGYWECPTLEESDRSVCYDSKDVATPIALIDWHPQQ